ncbi:MAG: hypothetical protein FWE98_04015 [Oscillospiraceae bacterium]|nr:hypothetical protein [Oscillospiraceae bacterium]
MEIDERNEAYQELLELREKLLEAELQVQRGEVYTFDEVKAMLFPAGGKNATPTETS